MTKTNDFWTLKGIARRMKPKKDICPICGKELDLDLPHAYDRTLGEPIHRECEPIEIDDSLKPEITEVPF